VIAVVFCPLLLCVNKGNVLSSSVLERSAVETIAAFDECALRPGTIAALTDMGITSPTPIQAAALPALMAGRDLIGQARTGSGKTLAFGIPAAELVDTRLRAVQVLVLTPTRELATQVGGVLDKVGGPRGVITELIYGGRAMGPQRDALRRGAHIVVGTPGRVLDLLNQGALRLDQVRFLVLDEADEMLDRGFAPDVERIMSRTQSARQTALFSATVPDWVQSTASKHLFDPVVVTIDPNPEDAPAIEHVAYDVPAGEKLAALRDLLDHRGGGQIIVFGRTKHGVKKLARQLEAAGYPVGALQGNLSQNARDAVMEDFRDGRVQILLATNVAARGLDIASVDQVINFELPESPELLTHRVGRTGRMGRRGQALTFLDPEDGAKWRQLERGLGKRIPRRQWQGAIDAIEFDPATIPASTPEPLTRAPKPAPSAPRERTSAPRERTNNRNSRPAEQRERSPRPSPRVRVAAVAVDDVRQDQRIEPSKDLVKSFGRDPNRPSWASGAARADATEPRETGSGEHRRSRPKHEVTCSSCGGTATVRFNPDPTRPVYCDSCYRTSGGRRAAAAESR
jgi:ATP-dependent RNA helicase DeaD